MPSNGYKRSMLHSPCCNARVQVSSFSRTVEESRNDEIVNGWCLPRKPVGAAMVGVCHECDSYVMRINPETNRQEWLPEGVDPLTRRQLVLVSP